MTVSKIFILGKHEIRPTLEKFMDPKDIPKLYGGALDWEWGQLPHLDTETREALETDGNTGWVKGPTLWLNRQRVTVGSEKGKLRRPDPEVAKLKPVVYAADGTEEPVHPQSKDATALNGALIASSGAGASPAPVQRSPSQHAATAAQAATSAPPGTSAAATEESIERRRAEFETKTMDNIPTNNSDSTTTAASAVATSDSSGSGAPEVKDENVRKAPMDGAPLNLPDHQPGFPEKTAEYISESDKPARTDGGAASKPQHEPAPAPVPATASVNSTAPSSIHHSTNDASDTSAPSTTASSQHGASATPAAHPPSQPIPGPQSTHQLEVNKAITAALEGESLSTIPSNDGLANGDIPHPEVIVSSDKSKGLAIEAGKLNRPGMERFVTAAEIPVRQ